MYDTYICMYIYICIHIFLHEKAEIHMFVYICMYIYQMAEILTSKLYWDFTRKQNEGADVSEFHMNCMLYCR